MFSIAAVQQIFALISWGFTEGKGFIQSIVANAKARGYAGDTSALLAAADEADKLQAEAAERAK